MLTALITIQLIEMPWKEEDKWVQYHDAQKQFKVPFIMYADSESILEPIEKNSRVTCTERINRHVPSGFCVYSKFAYGDVLDSLKGYREKSCVEKFVDHIEEDENMLSRLYPEKPMILFSEVLQREHEEATECHICMKPFDDLEKN